MDAMARLRRAGEKPRAINPMLDALVETGWDDILHDRILQRLPELGAASFERVMRLLDEIDDEDARESLLVVASQLGVRDPVLFESLRDAFAEDLGMGAMLLQHYGDPSALPDLLEAIEDFDPDFTDLWDAGTFTELVGAFEHLGGTLPDDLRERNEAWKAHWDLTRARTFAPARREKVGRNDPCPCGSIDSQPRT